MNIKKFSASNLDGYLKRNCYRYWAHYASNAVKNISGWGGALESGYIKDWQLGWKYYDSVPANIKKPKSQVTKELSKLQKYWHCFPDSYFVYNMFMKDKTDWNWMISYLPQEIFDKFAIKGADSQYNIILDDKILFRSLMSQYGVRIASSLFVYFEGNFYDENVLDKPLSDEEVERRLKGCDTERIFAKSYTGGQGSGIHLFERKDGLFRHIGNVVTAKYIREWCGNSKFFFEKQVVNDNVIRSINPSSLNTIRVTVKQVDGVATITSAALRVGVGGCYMDNMHQGGLGVNVDLETGALGRYGRRKWDYNQYEQHPDTGVKFDGIVIEQWNKVKELVFSTMRYLPYFRSLGFDVATTADGSVIIEINTYPGDDIAQIVRDRGFAEEYNLK